MGRQGVVIVGQWRYVGTEMASNGPTAVSGDWKHAGYKFKRFDDSEVGRAQSNESSTQKQLEQVSANV